jgi:hypothetical protein
MKKLTLTAAILTITAIPFAAQAQAPKPTKASAQKVVQIISGDKAKTAVYCQISDLGPLMDEADQKKDRKKMEELTKKADELSKQLGPEYAALMDGMQNVNPDSKDGKDIGAILDQLDKLCAKK